jgi:squalene-hopene/tetraprenyl-beta-curcumene cyclase
MRKIMTTLLIFLVLCGAFNFSSMLIVPNAHAEPNEHWPGMDLNGDGTIDIIDAVEYMKTHYLGYDPITDTFKWSFSDSYDIAMANNVIRDSLEIERIRNKYKDATVMSIIGKSIGLKDLNGVEHPINSANDAAAWVIEMIMKDKSYIMQVLHPPLEWIVNNAPDVLSPEEATEFSSGLADYMLQKAEEWLQELSKKEWEIAQKLKFDTALSDKLGKYAGKIRIVFTLKTIVDASIKHVLVLWEIMQSSVMAMIKSYEYAVEIYKWVVDVLGDVITEALSNVAASKGAAALMVGAGLATANPAIAVGVGIVGYFTIKLTVGEMLSATWDWAIDEATTRVEVLKRLNPLYKFINLQLTGDAKTPIKPMKIKILSITDEDRDYIIPWGEGETGEDIQISVVNTGVQDLNLRITPSEIPENWQINKNKVQFALKVGESKSAIFHVISYTKEYNWWDPFHLDGYKIHPGENPGIFYFRFEHDEHLEWWDIGDWFPGGLIRLFDTDVSEVFFNRVDFEVTANPGKTGYTRGEPVTVTVRVKNCRETRAHFSISVFIRDPFGESEKYISQITVVPNEGTLDPGQSGDFAVSWIVPLDALIGEYQIGVEFWEELPHFCRLYIDNLEWQQIFSVYEIYLIYPTTSLPANAGDYENPQRINAFVAGFPSYLWIRVLLGIGDAPTFTATVGGKKVLDVSITFKFGGFGLSILPPPQDNEGLYDFTIFASFDDVTTSASQRKAVQYTKALPTEPILKGLAWLRAQQYADGSWRGSVGVTSLAVLAFLNAGYDETDATVSKAINYILSNVKSDGSIYNSYPTYETSLAILPLVATHNDTYKATIENARNWLVGAQQDETFGYTSENYQYGGWTYGSYQGDPDLSNTQFALLALDAANLPKTDPTWSKAVIFIQRCQNRPESNDQAWAHDSSRPSYNDGGFIYRPWGWSLAGGTTSYGSMTGAGIWGLLLCGVPKTDERVVAAMNWVRSHYTWDTNPGIGWWRMYYYYLSMSKALTMYGQPLIDGHDWYQELYNKIVGMQIDAGSGKGYWSTSNEDDGPELTTAYAILSLQTRAIAPPVQRLSYLTFILRSNCLLRITDPQGNAVGYNYTTGLGENQVPTAIYSGPFMEPQYIIIVNPRVGTYQLELIGISEGPYELTIQGNYGEEVTDTFTYQGEIKPAELHGTDVTVTAIVGPIDVYANPPEFQEIIDNISPTTTLEIGEPKYADLTGDIYVSSITPFTLTAEDNPGGTGVASTFYRIYNSTYDTGWMEYSGPFYLTGLSDGEYSIDYYSIDNIGNVEPTNTATIILDNTPPTTTLTIGEPKYASGITYVTPDTSFTLEATDTSSGVYSSVYRIHNSTYDSGWMTYTGPFYLTSLTDGTYTIEYYSIDNVQNIEAARAINVTSFSWNYIFEDTYGRGTILKINIANKFFQFITPDKDYGIRKATYMRQCGRAIIIHHYDDELRLITTVVDTKLDFCVAIAWDQQTGKRYFLIDKVGNE